MAPVVSQIQRCYFPLDKERVLFPFECVLRSGIPHSYIVFDFETEDEKLRIREGGLVSVHDCFIYQDEKNQSGAVDNQANQKSTT